MKRGAILINPYDGSPAYLNQSERLQSELKALGCGADIVQNSNLTYIDGNGRIESSLFSYDFCVYLDKDKYTSAMLEKTGLRLFNRHSAVRACDDKMSTHILLAERGIKMPATVAGALCYSENPEKERAFCRSVALRLGLPVVVKACYGSLGKQVYKADDIEELYALSEKLRYTPHLYQKYIAESAGTDFRIILVGGKVVAAMKRVSRTDFRSNIDLGGTGETIEPDAELKDISERAAAALNLDYCGVDVLKSQSGYLVCEVNSNAFFGGIEKVTGVNVARAYAEHILRSI